LFAAAGSMGQVRLHLPSDSGRQTNSPPPPPADSSFTLRSIHSNDIHRGRVYVARSISVCKNERGRCQLVSVCQPPSYRIYIYISLREISLS
jgi:hypothetical protein